MTAQGKALAPRGPGPANFAIWWDGDLLRESLDGTRIFKYNPGNGRMEMIVNGSLANADRNNGSKANPVLSADLLGDWREEVVWRRADNSALLVFSTTAPTDQRLPTLMHNPQYRAQVAGQNAGYNQPPHPSFFLGAGMAKPSAEPVTTP